VPVSYFLLFLCFRKVTHEIFSELDETKAEVPNYLTRRESPKESRRRTRGRPHLLVARAPWPSHQGCDRLVHPLTSPFLLFNPLDGKTLGARTLFQKNILQAAAIVDARLRGSRSSSRHPTEKGNHHRRPSSSPCLPPSDV
jgi:hypothetical protein